MENGKCKVIVLSPGSALCSADFDSRLSALLCRFWQVPTLVIGPSPSIYPSRLPAQLPGEYTTAHTQLDATAYISALTSTHFLLGREKQCSMKCLARAQRADTPMEYWTRDLTWILIPSPALYRWANSPLQFWNIFNSAHSMTCFTYSAR